MKNTFYIVLLLATVVVSAIGYYNADRSNAIAEEQEIESVRYRLLTECLESGYAFLNESTVTGLELLGEASESDLYAAKRQRTSAVEKARDTLQEIREQFTHDEVGQLVSAVQEELDAGEEFARSSLVFGPQCVGIELLYFGETELGLSGDRPSSVKQIAEPAIVSQLVLAAAINLVAADKPEFKNAEDFNDEVACFVAAPFGMLSDDSDDLLGDYNQEAKEVFPGLMVEANKDIIESGINEFDQFTHALKNSGKWEGSPKTLAELKTASDMLAKWQKSAVRISNERANENRIQSIAAKSTFGVMRWNLFAYGLIALLLTLNSFNRDISWRDAMRLKSNIDPLTGIPNRRFIEHSLPRLLRHSQICHHAIGVIDLNQFKMINDVFGHAAGDEALVVAAKGLTKGINEWLGEQPGRRGYLVRHGGDEFVVTLHAQNEIGVERIGEILRRHAEVRPSDDSQPRITFSLGWSVRKPSDCKTIAQLLEEADQGTFADKERQRGEMTPYPRFEKPANRASSSHGVQEEKTEAIGVAALAAEPASESC